MNTSFGLIMRVLWDAISYLPLKVFNQDLLRISAYDNTAEQPNEGLDAPPWVAPMPGSEGGVGWRSPHGHCKVCRRSPGEAPGSEAVSASQYLEN